MIEIFHIINRALFEKKSIELPSFGKFVGEVKEAEIHPVEHRFSPKYLKVNFQLDKKAEGDYIIEKLAEYLEVSKEESKKKLVDFRNDILKKLKNSEKVIFKELGYMYWKAGHLYFEQDLKYNYLKESYGLKGFINKPVSKEKKQTIPEKTKIEKPKRSNRKLIFAMAASFVIIAMAGLTYWKWDNVKSLYYDNYGKEIISEDNKQNTDIKNDNIVTPDSLVEIAVAEDSLSTNDTLMSDSNTVAFDENLNEDSIEAEAKSEIEEVAETKVEKSDVENKPDDKYYIIAGCFREYNKATDYVEDLNNKGYSAELRGKTNGLHRVIYSAHPNYSNALNEMKSIIDKEGRGPWIQKIK